MADKKQAQPKDGKEDPVSRARAALVAGDAALARRHARAVLDDPSAGDDAKSGAREVLATTRIDPHALVAGALVLAVLALLFVLVLGGRF